MVISAHISILSGFENELGGRHEEFAPQQQIRKFEQNKKASKFENLLICNNVMAGHVSQFWNTIEPSLICMYDKLSELGFHINAGQVSYIEIPSEVRDVRPL
jgi:hypothetical protein